MCGIEVPCAEIHVDFDQVDAYRLEGVPSVQVGDVNVITGAVSFSVDDLSLQGVHPLQITRTYSSEHQESGLYGFGWKSPFESSIQIFKGSFHARRAIAHLPTGTLCFKGKKRYIWADKDQKKQGINNFSFGFPSSRTCPWQKLLTLRGDECTISGGGGETYFFKKGDKNHLLSAKLSDTKLYTIYSYNNDFALKQVVLLDRENVPLHTVNLSNKGIEIEGFGKLRHTFKEVESKRYLASVINPFSVDETYEYTFLSDDKKGVLTKKNLPEGRYQKFSYYSGGKYFRRAKAVTSPLGPFNQEVDTHTFTYKDLETHVTDANGHLTKYSYDKDQQLKIISTLEKGEKLLRQESFSWTEEKRLSAHCISSQDRALLFCMSYQYNEQGDIERETSCGDFLGVGGFQNKDVFYEYTSGLVSKKQEPGGFTTHYRYDRAKKHLIAQFIEAEDKIQERNFYTYSPSGALIEEILDDGESFQLEDLMGITYRKIKKIKNDRLGNPLSIEEYVLDLLTGKELLEKITQRTYTLLGKISEEKVYGSDGILAYTLKKTYDSKERLLSETDGEGNTKRYQYNFFGDVIEKSEGNGALITQMSYDLGGRLILEEERCADGQVNTLSYVYDPLGNLIEKMDRMGEKHHYVYDALNRLVKKVYPPLLDEEGVLYFPEETIEYDPLNHPISYTDKRGNTTQFSLTCTGKPFHIIHPDGREEKKRYDLHGRLVKEISPTGRVIEIDYDFKHREIEKRYFNEEGTLLKTESKTYSTFFLLSETDGSGVMTRYTYDPFGRAASVEKAGRITHYRYDSLGHLSHIIDSDLRVTYRKYSPTELLLEESILYPNHLKNWNFDRAKADSSSYLGIEEGIPILKTTYEYDSFRNETAKIVHTSSQSAVFTKSYSPYGQLIYTSDPEGNATHYHYSYDHLNSSGQFVVQMEQIDSAGKKFLFTYDTHGNIVREERYNALGELIHEISFCYDPTGKLLKSIECGVTTVYTYDVFGNQTSLLEAGVKKTCWSYTEEGELKMLTLPSGVTLLHTYDALGRLIEKYSSDQTIHYRYAYDLLDNLLMQENLCDNQTLYRSYTPHSELAKETYPNGKEVFYTYDALGRLKRLTLLGRKIKYIYDSARLRAVRYKANGQTYTHQYAYDLSGRVVKETFPKAMGEVMFSFDPLLRIKKIASPYHSQRNITYDSLGHVTQYNLGPVVRTFHYNDHEQLVEEPGNVYVYDALHNRIEKNGQQSAYNSLNQVTNFEGTSYQWDDNGCLLKAGDDFYAHDALGRLTKVFNQNGLTTFTYDTYGRCLTRTHNGETTYHLHQGEKEVAELCGESVISYRVLGVGYAEEVGATLAIELSGTTYIPLHDFQGNILHLIHPEKRTFFESYVYTAYGEAKHSHYKNPWRFSSKRYDPAIELYRFGARDYSPRLGRFITPDPLWFIDTPNLYAYVKSSPLTYIDPDGRGLFGSLFSYVLLPQLLGGCFGGLIAPYWEPIMQIINHFGIVSNYVTSYAGEIFGAMQEGVLFTAINGMNNKLNFAKDTFQLIAELFGGSRLKYIYNASAGWLDGVEAFLNYCGHSSEPANLLVATWTDFFKNNSEGYVVHVCHSQGVLATLLALKNMPQEMTDRIFIIAVSPPAYIDEALCKNCVHLVGWDFVTWLDPLGAMRNQSRITFCPSTTFRILPFDHSLRSESFKRPMIHARENFMDTINEIRSGK